MRGNASGGLGPGLGAHLGFRSTHDPDASSSSRHLSPKCKSECVGTNLSLVPVTLDWLLRVC